MTMFTRRAVTASSLALLAGCATSAGGGTATTPRGRPAIGAFGIDMAAIDPSVKPGDDFFQYVNGAWLNANTIPEDRTSWGTNDMLTVKAEHDVRAIIEEAAAMFLLTLTSWPASQITSDLPSLIAAMAASAAPWL